MPDSHAHSQDILARLMHLTSRSCETFEHKISQVLKLLRTHLDLELGILARVEDNRYEVFAIDAPGMDLEVGARFDLASTYCEHTITRNYVTSFHYAGQDNEWQRHPAYSLFKLEAYIGVSVTVGGECFGTLNFSRSSPRKEPFSLGDHELITVTGQWISKELERLRDEERARHEILMLRQSVASARDHAMRSHEFQKHLHARLFQELHMPLRGIASLSMQMVQSEMTDAHASMHRLEAIHTSSTHLLSVVSEVLDTSSISSLGHTPRAECFSLHTVLEEVATILAPLAHQQDLYLDICLEAMLPDEVCGDPVRLRQILMNLLSDSITRTTEGGIFLRCSLDNWEVSDEQALMIIDIQDTSSVFTTQVTSTGDSLALERPRPSIGVEIAGNLIEMMGGQLKDHAHGGHGLERRILMPLRLTQASRAPDHMEVALKTWISCVHDPLLLSLETSCARYGAQLVSHINEAQVCLIDSAQPHAMDLLAQARQQRPTASLYMLVEPSRRAEFADMDVDGILDKPLRQRQLVDLFKQAAPSLHVTQHMTMTSTLSMEINMDDLELGEWLLPPSFKELDSLSAQPLDLLHDEHEDMMRSSPSTCIGIPTLTQSECKEDALPILDASIYDAFVTHHEDTAFLRELTQDFFIQGARLLSKLREQSDEVDLWGHVSAQVEQMHGTAQCLGLLRVSAQCHRITTLLTSRPEEIETISDHIKQLGEHLNDAFDATQERLKAEDMAS
jgi:hypothetical protein